MIGFGLPELVVLLTTAVVGGVLVAFPASRICAKAGFSPWLGVAAIMPIVNLGLLWFLAMNEWPAQRERLNSPD